MDFDVWSASESREYAVYVSANSPDEAAKKFVQKYEYETPVKVCVCVDDGPVTFYEVEIDDHGEATARPLIRFTSPISITMKYTE